MKPLGIILVLISVALLGADVHRTADPRLGIQGVWNAKDPEDHSCLRVQITRVPQAGDRVYSLVGSDRDAKSWCEGASRMHGIGVMQPDGQLLASLVIWCMPDASELQYFHTDALRYDAATDTIADDEGVVFHRQVLLTR